MIILYHAGGAKDFQLLDSQITTYEWRNLKNSTCRLLRARKYNKAAKILETSTFKLFEGTNVFGDDFYVLYDSVPIEKYVEMEEQIQQVQNIIDEPTYSQIAEAMSELGPFIRFIAIGINTDSEIQPVDPPTLRTNSEIVVRALSDAQNLLNTSGAISAIDRVHTAIHGYIKSICDENELKYKKDASITSLYKLLRENHPKIKSLSSNSKELDRIVKSFSTILDSINTIRNNFSVAHPNENLLNEDEAILVINSVRTILHFLDSLINK